MVFWIRKVENFRLKTRSFSSITRGLKPLVIDENEHIMAANPSKPPIKEIKIL